MWLHRRVANLLLLLPVLGMLLPARAQSAGGMGTVPGEPCAMPEAVRDSVQNQPISSPSQLVDVAGKLFFVTASVKGPVLWKIEGAPPVARPVSNPPPWEAVAVLGQFTAVGNLLFFTVTTSANSMELWRSDGTSGGTVPLRSFPSNGLALQAEFIALGNVLIFSADNGPLGFELWRSDGTPAGTLPVKNINPNAGSSPSGLTVMNGQVFFAATDGASGEELWRSDGTVGSASQVKDIRVGFTGSLPSSLRVMGGKLYFTATDGNSNSTLWTSDGTDGGTHPVAPDALANAQGVPQDLTVAGSTLFFRLTDSEHDEEVWRSDGTNDGTSLVKDIKPGGGSSPQQFTAVGKQLFFIANDGQSGEELWRSDGTARGTMLVRDFISGPGGLISPKLAAGPGLLLAQINDGVWGSELWKSDGVGTARLTDIGPQGVSSYPRLMTSSGNRLFFVASDPSLGEVLFTLPLNEVDCFSPVIMCPSTQEVEAINPQGAFFSSPSAMVFDDAVTAPSVSAIPALQGVFPMGDTPVTLTATDAAGNNKSCTFHINVQDRTAPALLCPPTVEQEATGPSGAEASYFVVASDASYSKLTVSYNRPSGSVFPVGTTVIDVVASDGVKTSECHFPITVSDTVSPRLTCPQDRVFQATSAEPIPVDYEYTAYDAVTPSLELITEHPPGSLFPVGNTHVELAVKDRAGNNATCSFWVKNVDPEPPTITCPGPQQVATSKSEGAVVRFPAASATDNLGETTVSYSHEPGSVFPVGETLVTATATDAGEQTASCTFPVTVQEQISSGIGCQAGASGGSLGWLLLALVPLWARRLAARVAE